jgi:nitroreductase
VERLEELQALVQRPSVRCFDPERTVEPAVIEKLVDVARRTGSARNRQPWRCVAVFDRAVLQKLGGLGAYAQHVATAPVALVLLSADNGYRDTEFDLGRLAQTITLAAGALGLDSCLATIYPDANVMRAAELVGARAGWLPRHALSLGYGAVLDTAGRSSAIPTGRTALEELLTILPCSVTGGSE